MEAFSTKDIGRIVTYGFDPQKVGVMGFSAGGHLAAAVSVLRSGNEG